MLTWKSHGGSCSGISHVSGFRGDGPEAPETRGKKGRTIIESPEAVALR